MDAILRSVERLVEEQGGRLKELRHSHDALIEALGALRYCQSKPGGGTAAASEAAAAAEAAGARAARPLVGLSGGPSAAAVSGAESAPQLIQAKEQRHWPDADTFAPLGLRRRQNLSNVDKRFEFGRFGADLEHERRAASGQAISPRAEQRAESAPAGDRSPAGVAAATGQASPSGLRTASGGLDSKALRVVAEAHARGLHLSDLERLSHGEWERLGASPGDRAVILGAIAERRRQLAEREGEFRGLASDPPMPSLGLGDHLQGGFAVNDRPGLHGHFKDMDTQDGLARGIGHGRRHIPKMDHVFGGTAVVDRPGTHGHPKDFDFQGGLLRGVGHGKRYVTVAEHIANGVAESEAPGLHGHRKDEDMDGGIERGIGHGRHYIGTVDHISGGTATPEPPGSRGHNKDDEFQDGLARGIGHGKRYIGAADHIYGGASADDAPGAHGHSGTKDGALQDGMMRCIGHGKHHIPVRDNIRGFMTIGDDNFGRQGRSKDGEFQDGLERGIGHGRNHAACLEDRLRAAAAAAVSAMSLGKDSGSGYVQAQAETPTNGPVVESLVCGTTPPDSRPAGLPSRYSGAPNAAEAVRRRTCW
mmetsp:Transcript_19923/g.34157  ORF Transcript_19923/g.34157 Transcript_19923/m.34157 type:complete len:590 (-) Transcript_19923:85-1854(-)